MLFTGTFFISLFVLMMQLLWKFVDVLIGKGLSLDVLAEFFWYMAISLVPQALPLAVLLASLITYGNLGESSELTAIKASGTSLLQSFRSLIAVNILITLASFVFQNYIGPEANSKMGQLLLSMKQKSPELEIPEGVFYNGIPQTNLYVERKNLENGHLYNIMVYRMTDSYEDQAIILADSGMLQATADKKHLLLNLWSGQWFENMRMNDVGNSAREPYRRETFGHKKIVIDFDADFNLADVGGVMGNVRGKGIAKLHQDRDSLTHVFDSIGKEYYDEVKAIYYKEAGLTKKEKVQALKIARAEHYDIDSAYAKLSPEMRRLVVERALTTVQQEISDLNFKRMITSDGDHFIRLHTIEEINKYLVALTCLIFFFIGAPLGAIIRKGGLGVPIIISVIVFIVYFILQNTGYKMARLGTWAIWFGMGLSPAVLIPIATFFTYKANNDSTVFNMEVYTNLFMRMLGLRMKRRIDSKEVIIHTPAYKRDATILAQINSDLTLYIKEKKLKRLPNFVRTFFKYEPDRKIAQISERLEEVIKDLGNTRNQRIIAALNDYPIIAVKAHTRPFERRWMNILSVVLLPVGMFLYIRMWQFRIRLYKDIETIERTNNLIISEISNL